MKKYRFLKTGEQLQIGDESSRGQKEWVDYGYKPFDYIRDNGIVTAEESDELRFRREVPLEGEVQFLICVSILVPVRFNASGLTEEEVDAIAAETACREIMANPSEYVTMQNVDWEQSRVDDDEFQISS